MGDSQSKPGLRNSRASAAAPSQGSAGNAARPGASGGGASVQRSLQRGSTFAFRNKYGIIPDSFTSLAQVQEKLRDVGLESSNLIVGIDFTKSNEWTGKHSFGGQSLHTIGAVPNPYESAISIIGETLSAFDEDGLIPCFGFGDVSTHDQHVFSFNADHSSCNGFQEVLQRYRTITPHVKLSGPTSFAPIIEAAVRTVELSGGQYHVLLIIADGQVTRSVDLEPHERSEQERATIGAICAASNYPLSIVLVGVGDGPWDTMEYFDDALPQRNFDNFQFVNLSKIMASPGTPQQVAAKFALMALMEVPMQYRACAELDIVGKRVGKMPPRGPLPPPPQVLAADAMLAGAPSPSAGKVPGPVPIAPQAQGWPPVGENNNECAVCWQAPKGMAFQCGHQTCVDCGNKLVECAICRAPVTLRIKLYS